MLGHGTMMMTQYAHLASNDPREAGDSQPNLRFHDLRYTCASWLVSKGVPLKTVQESHKSFLTTLRYAHLAPELCTQAVERLSEVGRGHKSVTNGVEGPDAQEAVEARAAANGWGSGARRASGGAPRGTRTHDPVIKNHLLYQLS
jgi:hypothetical protein